MRKRLLLRLAEVELLLLRHLLRACLLPPAVSTHASTAIFKTRLVSSFVAAVENLLQRFRLQRWFGCLFFLNNKKNQVPCSSCGTMNAMGFLKCVSCKARGAGAPDAAAPAVEAAASSSSSEEEIASLKKQLEEANAKVAELEKKGLAGAPQTAGGTAVLASRLARQLAQAEKERDEAKAALAGAGAGSEDAMELVSLRNKVRSESEIFVLLIVFRLR